MKKNERRILSALIQSMSSDFERHMQEVYGEEYLEFRDKYYFDTHTPPFYVVKTGMKRRAEKEREE